MTTTEINKNVPELRFPEFEGEWVKKKIKEIAPLQRGFDLPNTKIVEGKFPVVFSNGILKFHSEYKVKGAGVVTGRSGTIGKVTFVKENYWPHNTSLWVTNFNDNYPKFIYYFYINLKLERYNAGSTVPTLNRNDVHILQRKIPLISEQQKISTFLTAVDKRIHLLTQKKEMLEQYKKGVMQQLFSRELRFRDDNGFDYPEWEEKRLGEIFEFIGTNSLSRSMLNYKNGTIKNIHYGDIHTKFKLLFDVCKEDVPYINNEVDISKFSNKLYCKEGDLIIADASEDYKDIGKSIEIININNQQLVSGLHTILARPKRKSPLGFNAYLMQSSSVRKQLMRLASGISVLGISKNNLSSISLRLPCFEEQQKIASFLSAIDKQIEMVTLQINHSNQWKKGLLQKMFV